MENMHTGAHDVPEKMRVRAQVDAPFPKAFASNRQRPLATRCGPAACCANRRHGESPSATRSEDNSMKLLQLLRAASLAAATWGACLAQASAHRIEAENAARTADLSVANDVSGYSGTGFVTPFSSAGAAVTATFTGVAAGRYDIRLRYHAYGPQQNFVSVNAGSSQDLAWPATHGSGNGWGDVVMPGVQLNAGTNTVTVSKGWGYIDLDYIELVTPPPTGSHLREAEGGTLSGTGVSVKTDDPTAHGAAYVGNFVSNGDTLTVSFPGVAAGNYDVHIFYRAWTQQQNKVQVNGGAVSSELFPASGDKWVAKVMPSMALVGGTNSIVISKEWGYMDVDYIQLVPTGSPPLPKTLVEAESGTVTGTGVSVKTDDPNAHAGAYVGNFVNNGDKVTVSMANLVAGTYDVTIRYRAWGTQRNFVQINGGAVRSEEFPAQNNVWLDHVMPDVPLVNGTNTFVISKEWGYMDVDYIQISKSGTSTGTPGWSNDQSIPLLAVNSSMPDFLQVGPANHAYWVNDGEWGAGTLTRGTYTGPNGSQYESAYGRSLALGPNGEVAWRSAWKWPVGSTEVKAYPSAIFGAKPGYANPSNTPGGFHILLPDGTYATTAPSGPTPGTFLPLPANGALPPIRSSFAYTHLVPPSGRGQLAYDIWLQSSPQQAHGWGAPPISHEIMIPLDYWGNYGAHGYRNPGWYSHDVVLEGLLWHVYFVRNFAGGWTFIVFEPDAPIGARTLNLSTFVNYITTRVDSNNVPWANGSESLVSVELGVEPVDGIGDIKITNYRVWKP
jgi:hypothetical protein